MVQIWECSPCAEEAEIPELLNMALGGVGTDMTLKEIGKYELFRDFFFRA
jgi:hypothetical protein